MYALCVSGAVNTQGFVWKFFMRYIYIFIHSFTHSVSLLFDICQEFAAGHCAKSPGSPLCIQIPAQGFPLYTGLFANLGRPFM